MKQLAQVIKARRHALGYKVPTYGSESAARAAFADRIRLSGTSLYQLERGECDHPRLDTIQLVAAGFGIKASELLEEGGL